MRRTTRQLAILFVAILVLDAVAAHAGSLPKANLRGNKQALAAKPSYGRIQAAKHLAVIKNNQHSNDYKQSKNSHKKSWKPKTRKIDEGECTEVLTVEECSNSKGNTENGNSIHNNYTQKWQTIECVEKTVDEIYSECATVDVIENKETCIDKVECTPVELKRVKQIKKNIKVIKPIQKCIQVVKTVNKPIQTLVTENVTVYELVNEEVCVDTLECYSEDARKVVETKTNVRYVEPKETRIRVVRSVKKPIRIVKSVCAQVSQSISRDICTKPPTKTVCEEEATPNTVCENNEYSTGGFTMGNRYQATQNPVPPVTPVTAVIPVTPVTPITPVTPVQNENPLTPSP
jgi:hypothetical protein